MKTTKKLALFALIGMIACSAVFAKGKKETPEPTPTEATTPSEPVDVTNAK